MDGNMFSSVTPINCCWHCPLEMCDNALALQILTREASSLLWSERGRASRCIWVWIYKFLTSFPFHEFALWAILCSTHCSFWSCWTAWQESNIECSVWSIVSLPARKLLSCGACIGKGVIGHRCADQYRFTALIYWVGFAENGKPVALFKWIHFFFFFRRMNLAYWWLSSWITHCLDFEREPWGPFHKRLMVLQTPFQSEREKQTLLRWCWLQQHSPRHLSKFWLSWQYLWPHHTWTQEAPLWHKIPNLTPCYLSLYLLTAFDWETGSSLGQKGYANLKF